MQTKRINKSYAKGTPIKTVIEDLAKQMGLHLGNTIDHFKELCRIRQSHEGCMPCAYGKAVQRFGAKSVIATA